jgi:glyoxylase-like metal-dependent hydrolase (beta-lactamase superfamily II)
MKRKGTGPKDLRYVLATHFHPDHAGILQELKDAGAKHILMESQPDFIAPMVEQLKRKGMPYLELHKAGTELLAFKESRKFLHELGLAGEILPTPGHSDDSVTLVLDKGIAFTGDLPPEHMLAEDNLKARASWSTIRQHGVKRIFPAHGEAYVP